MPNRACGRSRRPGLRAASLLRADVLAVTIRPTGYTHTDLRHPGSLITTPIDRLKILQQALIPTESTASALTRKQPSLLALVRSMSLPSLYRGWSATILRDIGYGPYFLTYEYVVRGGSFGLFSSREDEERNRRHVKADPKDEIDGEVFGVGEGEVGGASTVRVLVAGGLAGIVGWGCT